jgi:hypothetical protein
MGQRENMGRGGTHPYHVKQSHLLEIVCQRHNPFALLELLAKDFIAKIK